MVMKSVNQPKAPPRPKRNQNGRRPKKFKTEDNRKIKLEDDPKK